MFFDKRLLALLGVAWFVTLAMAYLTGGLHASLECLDSINHMEGLEEQFADPNGQIMIPEDYGTKYEVGFSEAVDGFQPTVILDANTITPSPVADLVAVAADQYPNLSYWLLMGLIEVESGGDPKVVSRAGAIGLMQIMPATGQEISQQLGEEWAGLEVLYDVETNIRYGAYYLNQLFERFEGNQQAAIAAYNWGPNHISRRIRNGSKLPVIYPGKVIAAVAAMEGT